MKCSSCYRTAVKLDELGIAYLISPYDILRCFPCFTCSKCHQLGEELEDGGAKLLAITPILCTKCYKCPCGNDVTRWTYEILGDVRKYFCNEKCQTFYTIRDAFFLFIFALKEQGVYREFRYLLPMIFHAVKKIPNRRCIDCWQACYKSANVCANCNGTQCFAMQERNRHKSSLDYGMFGMPIMRMERQSRFPLHELPINGFINICDRCELRRPMPYCSTSKQLKNRTVDETRRKPSVGIRRTEDAHYRFTSRVYHVHGPRVPKQKVPKNTRNPTSHGYVPKNQKHGKMGEG